MDLAYMDVRQRNGRTRLYDAVSVVSTTNVKYKTEMSATTRLLQLKCERTPANATISASTSELPIAASGIQDELRG